MAAAILEPFLIRAAGRDAASKQKPTSSTSKRTLARPFVLPQQWYDADSAFVRAHCALLPVSEAALVGFVDALNAAMLKSPEAQAVTAASFAGMLLPGVGTVLGAVVGAGAQVHAARQRREAVAGVLEQANAAIFRPQGLVLGTEQLHDLLGLPPPSAETPPLPTGDDDDDDGDSDGDLYVTDTVQRPTSSQPAAPGVSPTQIPHGIDRLAPYRSLTLEPTTVLPPIRVTYQGRDDVLATAAARGTAWRAHRREAGAAKRAAKGKGSKLAKLNRDALWLVVT